MAVSGSARLLRPRAALARAGHGTVRVLKRCLNGTHMYGTIYRVLTAYSKGYYVALVGSVSVRQVSPDVLLRTCHTASAILQHRTVHWIVRGSRGTKRYSRGTGSTQGVLDSTQGVLRRPSYPAEYYYCCVEALVRAPRKLRLWLSRIRHSHRTRLRMRSAHRGARRHFCIRSLLSISSPFFVCVHASAY